MSGSSRDAPRGLDSAIIAVVDVGFVFLAGFLWIGCIRADPISRASRGSRSRTIMAADPTGFRRNLAASERCPTRRVFGASRRLRRLPPPHRAAPPSPAPPFRPPVRGTLYSTNITPRNKDTRHRGYPTERRSFSAAASARASAANGKPLYRRWRSSAIRRERMRTSGDQRPISSAVAAGHAFPAPPIHWCFRSTNVC